MSFIQNIFSSLRLKRYLNSSGRVLATDVNGDLTLVPGPDSILPYGLKGQIIKVNSENKNQYSAQEPLVIGSFVNNDADLAAAKTVFVSQEAIFSTWKRFVHGKQDPLDPYTDSLPGDPPQTNTWSYDSVTDTIASTFNSNTYLGFVSKILLNKYTHKATMGSTDADNDFIGLLIAFNEDPDDLVPNNAYGLNPADFAWPINVTDQFIPNQHTLTLFRNRNGSTQGYFVVYNHRKQSRKVIVDGSSMVWTTNANWSGATVDVEVIRDLDVITVRTTDFSDAPGGKGSLGHDLVIDLNSDPLLNKFKGFAPYGYGCHSQALSSFTNVSIDAGINEIYDLRNGNIWVADNEGVYSIDSTRNLFTEISPRTFLFNETTGLEFYIKSDSTVITINNPVSVSGDHGQFNTTDTGQSAILIPHGLSSTPTYWNVSPKNSNAKNIGISDESADSTNIILTPVFTNNDGAILNYLWDAKL